MLEEYEIDVKQSKSRLDKAVNNLISNLSFKNTLSDKRKNLSDEDIMFAYNVITTKYDLKKEKENVATGRINKNNKPIISKKLF